MRRSSRRQFLKHSLALAAAGPLSVAVGHRTSRAAEDATADPPTTHEPNLYLFVDDRWIAQRAGLSRVINRAVPLAEPIVWPDDPRTQTDFAWGNVIREPDGRFRLWYGTMNMGHNGAPTAAHEMASAGVWGRGDDYSFHPRSEADVREVETMLGKYAESGDGIRWEKPELGLIEFRGSKRNNILLNGELAARQSDGHLTNFDGYTIVRDDAEPDSQRRYKMIAHWESVHCWDNHELSGSLGRSQQDQDRFWAARGKYVTYSPDGVRWEQVLERINFPDGGGDRFLVIRDYRHGRWWGYSRAGGHAAAAFSTSDDLVHWSPPAIEELVTPQAVAYPAIECLVPFNYGNQDLGFPVAMDKPRGILPPFLASHHDGRPWQWIDPRDPFIPPGEPGTYCATGAVPLHNEPIIVGDELYIYFNAFSRFQETPCPFGTRSIGVARLRRDGFAGLTAADRPGTLVTRPMTVAGNRLFVNVEQRGDGGRVEIALLDSAGNAIPGYGLAGSMQIDEDGVRLPVTWNERRDVRGLLDRDVRLAVRVQGDAILYAAVFA